MLRNTLIALGALGLAGVSGEALAQGVVVSSPAPATVTAPAPTVGGSTIPGAAAVTTGTPITTSVGGVLVGSPVVNGTAAGTSAPIVWGAPAGTQTGPIHAYSYYVEFPNPARTYVPYGPTDTFTFQGNAYGHAYDRWTWAAMSNASPGLGRYYQLLH